MKISKLFHLLYAIVLLLPVLSIGGKMLYVTFNKNAKESYAGSVEYLYTLTLDTYKTRNNLQLQSYTLNNVTNYYYDIKILQNNYRTMNNNIYGTNGDTSYGLNFEKLTYTYNNVIYTQENSFVLFSTARNSQLFGHIKIYDNYLFNKEVNYITKRYDYWADLYENGTLVVPTYEYYVTNVSILPYDDYIYFTSNNNVAISQILSVYETDIFFTDTSLSSAFYSALEDINSAPIFAWAKDSFLVEPIAYVSELFGLSNTSPLITLLSYWLNMSIIWLCFDIIMYVPLMAHRWLDKGAIE